MTINLTDQLKISPALPLRRTAVFTASALPVAVAGVPEAADDGSAFSALSVTLTNADAEEITAPCTKGDDGLWRTAIAASFFSSYGYVEKGVKIAASLTGSDGTTHTVTLAVGDLDILPASASAQPGDPASHYQQKGGDIYLKSEIVDGVQHYKKQELLYDDDMAAWGLDWTGDYILSNGDFVEVTQ